MLYFVLSEEYLIIRNTYLTCLPPIRICDVDSVKIKNAFFGKKLHFKLVQGDNKYLKIRIKKTGNWEATFKKISIKVAPS